VDQVSKAQQGSTGISEKSLANLRPWKPGQSGNPSGRPKRQPITDLCEEIMSSEEAREAIKRQMIKTLTSKGMAGVLLLREIAERTEGKVSQDINLSGSINTMTDQELMERMAKLLETT
jgi:hypothetical protein